MLGNFFNMKRKIITNQKEKLIFGIKVILNMKVMVTKVKPCQLKTILMKLGHT